MFVVRPGHLLPDTSLPASLERPQVAAHQYVGRKVCKFFEETGAWYTGSITSVSVEDGVAYLKVAYDDGDDEEFHWEDFRECAVMDKGAGSAEDHTPNDRQQQNWRGGSGGAAHGEPHGHASGSGGEANGSTQPPKRQRAAPYGSQQVAHPGAHSRPAHDQKNGHAGTGEHEQKTALDDEHSPPAARRRLNLEPYEPRHHPQPQLQSQPQSQPQAQQPQAQQPQAQQLQVQQQEHQQTLVAKAPPRLLLGGPEPFSAGHLHRIQLINFMCHENTEVMFNEHVTFVSGLNGSGKSALLQGLQVCLGASARDTGRGSSLGNWVNKERRTAVVTLEMWNTTEEEVEAQKWPPFRHEHYGSLIRIVRKVTASDPDASGHRTVTSSSYQLFAADGREVKRAELAHSVAAEVGDLAEHFNVDASNPLLVITQDLAKDFHQVTSGARCKKYEMYMAGTCLTKTRDTLAAAAANVARAAKNLRAHVERLQTRREEFKTLEKRLKLLQDADVYKQQLTDLELATVWAIVEEARAGLNAQKQAAAGYPARLQQLEMEVAEAQAAVAGLQNQEAALTDEMNNTRSEALLGRLEQLNANRQTAKRRRLDLARRLEQAGGYMRDLTDRRTGLEQELAALEAERNSEGLLARVREHQEEVDAKQAELVQIQAAATQLEAERGALATRPAEAEAAAQEAAGAVEAARAAAKDARDAHGELLAAAGGAGSEAQLRAVNTRLWGGGTMALMDAVRSAPAGTFSQPPMGPVGMYLRRTADCDPGLACLLDLALGRCLKLWLVNTHQGGQNLRQLATSIGVPRPEVLVQQYRDQPLNYGSEPVYDQQGRLWRRAIDLVEPKQELPPRMRTTLISALVHEGKAANVVLVDSREEGQIVGRNLDRALVARRVRLAYDRDGCSYAALGSRGMVTEMHTLPRTCRLVADNRAQLAESERAVTEQGAELQQAEEEAREAEAAAEAARRERKELQRRQAALARQQREAESQLSSLLEATPAAVSEAQSAELLNKLAGSQRDLAAATASQASLETDLNNANAEVEALTAEMETLHKQSAEYQSRRQELMGRINQLAQRKQAAAVALTERQQQLQAVRADQQLAQGRIDEFEKRVDQAYCEAARICLRGEGLAALENLRSTKREELAAKFPNKTEAARAELLEQAMSIRGLQQWAAVVTQRISRAQAEAGGDLGVINVQVATARAALERDKAAMAAVSKEVSAIHEAQVLRNAKYKWLRNQIEHVSNTKFGRYMQRRNISASLHLDHEAERLDLMVRKNHEAEQATSLMQLSGGERSFTTSSFLLAMGEVLDSPFRAMDEYDIYMDPGARKLATIALLEYAWRSNPTSQMILLSPQDTSTLTEAFDSLQRSCAKERQPVPPRDFVKVVQLRPPRGEAAGGR